MMESIQLLAAGSLRTFSVKFEADSDMGAPWKNEDGHGDVSDWTTRDKLPGELVLCTDRGSKRYYDFAGACKTALRDGWDAKPYNDGTESKREQAAKAALSDFEYLRQFCNDQWSYVGVIVTLLDDDGEETDMSESLWGVEDRNDYHHEVAKELAAELGEQLTAQEVARQSVTLDDDKGLFIAAANENYASDNISFDDSPEVSPSEKGAFVQAWVWVTNEQAGLSDEDESEYTAVEVDGESYEYNEDSVCFKREDGDFEFWFYHRQAEPTVEVITTLIRAANAGDKV